MSRAFVREQDAGDPDDLPERAVSEHPNDVTEAGLTQIEHALAAARRSLAPGRRQRPTAPLSPVPGEIFDIGPRGARQRMISAPSDHSEVRFGASVTILRDDGREQTFRIVGEDEADPARGTVSHVSPLARAMFGKRVGDVVLAGAGEAEIIRIQ